MTCAMMSLLAYYYATGLRCRGLTRLSILALPASGLSCRVLFAFVCRLCTPVYLRDLVHSCFSGGFIPTIRSISFIWHFLFYVLHSFEDYAGQIACAGRRTEDVKMAGIFFSLRSLGIGSLSFLGVYHYTMEYFVLMAFSMFIILGRMQWQCRG